MARSNLHLVFNSICYLEGLSDYKKIGTHIFQIVNWPHLNVTSYIELTKVQIDLNHQVVKYYFHKLVAKSVDDGTVLALFVVNI